MKFQTLLFLLLLFIVFPQYTHSQTQDEIKQMLNEGGEKPTKTKKSKSTIKKNLKERKKDLNQKEKMAKKKPTKAKEEELQVKKLKEKKTKKQKSKNKKNKNAKAKKNAKKDLNYSQLKKIADKLYTQGSFYNALEYYSQALFKAKKDKQKVITYIKIADANYFLRDYKQAENYYSKAIQLNSKPKKYTLLNYKLGLTQKYLAKYDEAIESFKLFREKSEGNKKMLAAINHSKIEQKGCVFAKEYTNENPKYKVENAGENVNSAFTDYGPEIVGSKLYFSKIISDKAVVLDDEIKEKEFSKIYYSDMYNDEFGLFQDFSKNINKANVHIGNPSFTKDGNTLYFTECTMNEKMQSQCVIYMSQKENGEWEEAKKLNDDINLSKTNNTQPQIVNIDAENQVLYFVSDRLSGKGGKDIWYVNINKNGEFSKAKNAGFKINTIYDELSPFYNTENKTLYFSSNGHTNFGGLDVFKISKNDEDNWEGNAENLGKPINSSLDDYDFVLNNNNDLGFLASNRIGTTTLKSETCCDDIFSILPTAIDIFVEGKVFAENETSRNLLEKADLYLYDASTNEKIETLNYSKGKSYFTEIEKDREYKILAMANGFKDEEFSFNTLNLNKSDTLHYDIFMKNRAFEKGKILSIIYYEFDVSKLREDAPDSLRKVVNFMKAYPNIIVEVGSHTDSKGTDDYNNKLSERRSLAAKNYLIYQQNIAEKRLTHKFYGESMPIAPNTNPDGTDNPKGRDLNRRTEFKIIGTLDEIKKD